MIDNINTLSSKGDNSVRPLFRLLAGVLAALCAVTILGVVAAWALAGFHPIIVLGLSLLLPGFHVSFKVARSGYPPKWLMRL